MIPFGTRCLAKTLPQSSYRSSSTRCRGRPTRTGNLGIRLLSDLRLVFGDKEALATESILESLLKLDESPWGDLRGKPLDARRLAHYLRPYGISSKQVRIGTATFKGYSRDGLWDAWSRYLGTPAMEGETRETSDTYCRRCGGEGCQWCAVEGTP